MAKKTKPPKVSLQAAIASKLLWTLQVKKDFESVERTNDYLEKRAEKNNEFIKAPRMKYAPKYFDNELLPLYVFNHFDKSEKVIVYFHGGAYNSSPLGFHFKFVEKIHKKTKMPVLMPLYPLAPNYTYKDAYEQLDSFYEAILSLNYEEIIFIGDSAGGGLAAGLFDKIASQGLKLPSKLVLLSPWVDITMDNPEIDLLEHVDPLISKVGLKEMGKVWAGNTDTTSPLLSPTFGNLSNYPETTIFVGTYEIFLPDIRLFKDKLLKQGVKVNYFEYFKMHHDFLLYPIPEAKKAIKQVVNILKSWVWYNK